MAEKMHAEEVEIDSGLVRRLLANQLPHWAELPLERVESTGTVNAIYRLGDDLCVRLPRVHSWAADLDKEVRWLPKLARHLPLAVPRPVAAGRPDDGYPFRWAVYRWLPGAPYAPARVDDPRSVATALARFVAALRRIDPSGAPASGRDPSLAERDAGLRATIESVRGVVDAAAVTAAWDDALDAGAYSGATVWTHGDLLPDNLLVVDGHLRAVIDFGIAGIGDPAVDLLPAWSVLTGEARDHFRGALAIDEATWRRGRGWALAVALPIIPYYPETNPAFVAMAVRMVDEVLADVRRPRQHSVG